MWPMWIAKIRPNGTPGDKYDLFDVIDIEPAEAIEQSVAEKGESLQARLPVEPHVP